MGPVCPVFSSSVKVELQAAIDGWKQANCGSKYFYRPYSTDVEHPYASDGDGLDSDSGTEQPSSKLPAGLFRGSGGGDGDDALQTQRSAQNLLFVHQEPWQQNLLAKYGNFAMIDATYRTTMYDIALFFVVVPTNVGYTVAAEFCVQSEGLLILLKP